MKILVVDDSIVFRSAIVSAVGTLSDIEVGRSLGNGRLAVDYLLNHQDVDLITLDMEMPVMDGIETIKEIRKFNKSVVIIVFSSLTQKGAEKTIEALNAGANDFVTKPENLGHSVDDSINSIKEELLPKILGFLDKNRKRGLQDISHVKEESRIKTNLSDRSREVICESSIVDLKLKKRPELVVIGCSTGGPEALGIIFRNIKNIIQVPMLIVQHMPPLFTQKLAEMLTRLSPVEVYEAKQGDKLRPGVCYIAPGDYHMTINQDGIIQLSQSEKVCFVRPSVDVLFNSVADHFRGHTLTIVLTGMGEDGAVGAKKLIDKGSQVFVQDKESSVVWGMPGSVKRQVPDSKVINLKDVGGLIDINCR